MGKAQIVRRNEYANNLSAISNPDYYREEIIAGKIIKTPTRPRSVIRPPGTNFEIYPLKHQFVSEKLNEESYEKLLSAPQNPIFVDAQTGRGKTTMIFQRLLPVLKRRGSKLLIINNRSALKQQTKYDAIEADAPELKEELTDIGITKHHVFGDIEIYSYQDFNNPENINILQKKVSSGYYGAIVFDECHYFIADADFNVFTEKQFNFLLPLAIKNQVLRIYLTATPDYVFDNIYAKECHFQHTAGILGGYHNFHLKHFYFKRNYEYLQIRFFPMESMTDIIIKHKDQKILVFTESKKMAIEEMDVLKEAGIESVFLFDSESSHDKESKMSNHVRKGLLNNDLNVDVLFATKCLDAGVTINTKDLIVICCLKDKVDFMQAIGRKRIKGNETVTLYIPLYGKNDILRYRHQLQSSLEKMKETVKAFPDNLLMNGATFPDIPIYVENGRYQHNKFSLEKVQSQLWDIQSLEDKITSSKERPKITIAKHFLSWMELEETFSTDMICEYQESNPAKENEERTVILHVIHEYEHRDLSPEDFQEIQAKLKCYDPRKDRRPDRSDLATQTINSIFSNHDLPYRIEKRDDLYRITPRKEEFGND